MFQATVKSALEAYMFRTTQAWKRLEMWRLLQGGYKTQCFCLMCSYVHLSYAHTTVLSVRPSLMNTLSASATFWLHQETNHESTCCQQIRTEWKSKESVIIGWYGNCMSWVTINTIILLLNANITLILLIDESIATTRIIYLSSKQCWLVIICYC
jgi:hypothetical protein